MPTLSLLSCTSFPKYLFYLALNILSSLFASFINRFGGSLKRELSIINTGIKYAKLLPTRTKAALGNIAPTSGQNARG